MFGGLQIWASLKKFHLVSSSVSVTEPNDESAANVDAAKMWREEREKFREIAEKHVRKTLGL